MRNVSMKFSKKSGAELVPYVREFVLFEYCNISLFLNFSRSVKET